MCGIAGFCDYRADFTRDEAQCAQHTAQLVQMRQAIAHRGQDQDGEYLRKQVGLAHARLSIRDISNGKQPMTRVQNAVEYTIVFNGEIYNNDDLRASLGRSGYRFETTCDTESILYAYMRDGADCVKNLNGIFAFAIWDGLRQTLFLARDQLGVKPLFYALREGALYFGSEQKALFAHPAVPPRVNLNTFREIFGIGPARSGGCGVFEGVFELKAGHCATFTADGLQTQAYWALHSAPHTDSYQDTVAQVRYLVEDAITKQMVSDVPVCSFLSGGLDSSIITAVAARVMRAQGGQLNTYSFDFKGNDDYFTANAFQPSRDRPFVDLMCAAADTNHTYLECDEADLVALLKPSMESKDLPGMADVDASLLYFCSIVKQQNKVALTGECADEIFGGYPWFYRKDLLEGDGFPWSKDIAARKALLQDDIAQKLDLEQYVRAQYQASCAEVPRLMGESGIEAKRREVTYLNIKWFMQTLLDRMDRASMHTGLESRVPFADPRIVSYVFNVPWEMKRKDGVEKSLLRDAFADLLPPELLYRKKSPYPKTYNPNYEYLLHKKLRTVLADAKSPLHAFVDVNKVDVFLEAPSDYGKPWFGQLMAGPQMVAYLLQLNDWLTVYHPQIVL